MSVQTLRFKALGRVCRKLNRVERRTRARAQLATVGLLHGADIHTYTTEDELDVLLKLASEAPAGSDVIEVGSYLGASTCYLAAGLAGRGCHLTCIDTWQNEGMPDGARDTLAQFEENLRPVSGMLRILRSRTDQLRPEQLPASASLIFLDAFHSYTATKFDFDFLSPLIIPNGVVAFHDTLFFRGVSRVLGDALASGEWRLEGCLNNLSWVRRADFLQPDTLAE